MELPSFEQEIKDYLRNQKIKFDEGCQQFDQLDFCIHSEKRGVFHFDAKEKRQPSQMRNWPDIGVPEEFFFILDDLAVRKTLMKAPRSGIVMRDNMRGKYYFASILDLLLMPRKRVNRPINQNISTIKGKWLIDLRNCHSCPTLKDVFKSIAEYVEAFPDIFEKTLECYGDYVGEEIGSGGITRRPEHWDKDVSSTR